MGLRMMVAGTPRRLGCLTPGLAVRAKRRTFTAKYKLEVLDKAEACTAPGEVGELLRREALYTSHLTYWRKQRIDPEAIYRHDSQAAKLIKASDPRGGRAVQQQHPL